MIGKRLTVSRAVLLLVGLWLAAPQLARAIEIQLPGERSMELHGFYELRLQVVGEDWPGNGMNMSQFRHVLNVETESEIFPDGIGPFDFMMAFTRWIVQYECAYQGGCLVPGFKNMDSLFNSYNFYGGERGDAVRAPQNLKKPAKSGPIYAGGLYQMRFRPGTIRPPREDLTGHVGIPSEDNVVKGRDRYFRDPINPAGLLNNPNPLAVLANLNRRTVLDEPVRVSGNTFLKNRAGGYASRFHVNYLQAARADLGEVDFGILRDQYLASEFLVNEQGSGVLHEVGQLRMLNTAIFQGRGDDMIDCNTTGQTGGGKINRTIRDCRNELLGLNPGQTPLLDLQTIDPTLQKLYEIDVPEGAERLNLLNTRPDPNRYESMARQLSPELLDAMFGASQLSHANTIAYLATLNTPIEPGGYFQGNGIALSGYVSPYALGLATDLGGFDSNTLPAGSQKLTEIAQNVVPGFFGPDGVRGTPDDMPFIGNNGLSRVSLDGVNYAGSKWANASDTATGLKTFASVGAVDGTVDERLPGAPPVVLFGEQNATVTAFAGCQSLGGSAQGFVFGTDGFDHCLLPSGEQLAFNDSRLAREGCEVDRINAKGGVNADGACIKLNLDGTPAALGVHVLVIEALGRRAFRPAVAGDAQLDLSDLVTGATYGRTPPARPPSPDNGVFYDSAGYSKLKIDSSAITSSLDLDFNVDELRWGHGASDDEHEFREGYLEFEMVDSQVWARVGKLIMVWGKTELFRNQDRMNPVDLSNGVITRLEEARVGQWAANVVFSPEAWMRIGPVEDMRLEFALIFDDFEPTDLGKCGEATTLALVCLKGFGAYAHGLAAIGVAGEVRPDSEYGGFKAWDMGVRLEGRWDRFTFAVTDFWGWDDGFYLNVVDRYNRRVDPETGAPVNAVGSLNGPGGGCKYRAADGSGTSDPNQSVGPDGDAATTNDNLIPSVGNCLLFDNPVNGEAQTLRASDAIAASHSANQTLFHTLCTLTYDPDQGFCAFDRLTNPQEFQLVTLALGFGPGAIANAAMLGLKTLRLTGDPFAPETLTGGGDPTQEVVSSLEGPEVGSPAEDRIFEISPEQGALLGCGPSFASACGNYDINVVYGGFNSDGSVEAALGIRGVRVDLPGGIDFMNANAAVLTEEFTVLKAGAQPDDPNGDGGDVNQVNGSDTSALIATVNREYDALGNHSGQIPLRWEAGITIGGLTQRQLQREDPLPGGGFLQNTVVQLPDSGAQVDLYDLVGADAFAGLSLLDRSQVVSTIAQQSGSQASDGWIEPLPWALDPDALALGEIRYLTADQNKLDPRCSVVGPNGSRARDLDPNSPSFGQFEFTAEETAYCQFRSASWTPNAPDNANVRNDPTDPSNPLNVFIDDYAQVAEVCHPFMNVRTTAPLGENAAFMQQFGGPVELDGGCTELERFSANLERFLITLEIVGSDRQFDPPETVDEILAMLDGDYSNDGFGDPISGVDGIFTLNGRVFNTETNDVQVLVNANGRTVQTFQQAIGQGFNPSAPGQNEDFFFGLYDANSCTSAVSCHLRLNNSDRRRDPLTGSFTFTISALPLSTQALRADSGQTVRFSPLYLARKDPGSLARLFAGEVVTVDTRTKVAGEYQAPIAIQMNFSQRDAILSLNINNDNEGIRDLDEDFDGVWDGADDFSPGPISDDNILCGSGIPGDILQDAAQFELYSEEQDQQFEQQFGEDPNNRTGVGLPFRSPVYCGGATGLLGATTQTLPYVKAGGDGNFGRRDFLWHGGQEVSFNYQKRNVFGFAVDFAEDVTKTSWGIEMSYLANGLLGNTNNFDGLENHDQIVMSVSVDRPTFFNFLNPNRSFFLNFQFFMRYIFNYDDSGPKYGGTWNSAPRAFSVPIVTFTFFTGYFQDRLSPRMTLVFDPDTHTGGVLWGLSYRWSGNFTTSLAMNQFYGPAENSARSMFPVVQYGDNQVVGGSFRGLTPVVNEDSVFMNVRYSW